MARPKSNQSPGASAAPKVPRQTGYAVTIKAFIPADASSIDSMSAAIDIIAKIKAGDLSALDAPSAPTVETKFTSRVPPPAPIAEA